MTSCEISLPVEQRINIAYGSTLTSGLSIIGSIGSIILILLTLRRAKLSKSISKQNLLDVTSHQFQHSQKYSALNSSQSTGTSPAMTPSPSNISLASLKYSSINNYNLSPERDSARNTLTIISNNSSNSNSDSGLYMSGNLNSPYSTYASVNSSSTSYLSNPRKKSHSRLSYFVINLSIADLIASSFIFLSRVMMVQDNARFIRNPVKNLSLCNTSNGLVAFSFLATFMWTFCISIHIYRQFNQSSYIKNQKKIYQRFITPFYYVLSWLVTLGLGAGIMFSSYIESGNGMPFCQINEYTLLFLYYAPLIVILLASGWISIKVKSRFQALSNHNLTSTSIIKLQSKVLSRLNGFVVVLFLCWIVSIVSFFVRLFGNGCQIYVLEFISNITSPSQGFLNFLCYLYSNNKFQVFSKLKSKIQNFFTTSRPSNGLLSSESSINNTSINDDSFSFRSND